MQVTRESTARTPAPRVHGGAPVPTAVAVSMVPPVTPPQGSVTVQPDGQVCTRAHTGIHQTILKLKFTIKNILQSEIIRFCKIFMTLYKM